MNLNNLRISSEHFSAFTEIAYILKFAYIKFPTKVPFKLSMKFPIQIIANEIAYVQLPI